MPIDHSIWSFAYAQGRLPADFMGGCPVCSNQGMVDIPMVYSLVTTGSEAARARTIAVDTGFKGGQSMTGRKFENIEMPDAVLGKVGCRPEDVDTVVLTHMHFDHAGNFDAFPKARFVVQRMEYERWQQVIASLPDLSVGKSSWMLSSLDIDVFKRFEKAIADGRVDFLDGDAEIAPGLWCRLAQDTHTFGSQWLEIATATGPYVIAGDCVYWYANVERMWPPGYVQGNTWNLMQAYERLRKVVGSEHLERIIPGHDGEIFTRHRSWTSGLNPVAEVHLAKGEKSRVREETT
jgi:glyoxylase-like metal-dependent hydrolase (beta-lactamase superfamily II)